MSEAFEELKVIGLHLHTTSRAMNRAIREIERIQAENERLRTALLEVKDAIVRADPDVLTDTLWMPEDTLKGATVVDRIDIALEAPSARAALSEQEEVGE